METFKQPTTPSKASDYDPFQNVFFHFISNEFVNVSQNIHL